MSRTKKCPVQAMLALLTPCQERRKTDVVWMVAEGVKKKATA